MNALVHLIAMFAVPPLLTLSASADELPAEWTVAGQQKTCLGAW